MNRINIIYIFSNHRNQPLCPSHTLLINKYIRTCFHQQYDVDCRKSSTGTHHGYKTTFTLLHLLSMFFFPTHNAMIADRAVGVFLLQAHTLIQVTQLLGECTHTHVTTLSFIKIISAKLGY